LAASDWCVLVLAAGRGARMGGPKALMQVRGRAWWQVQEERLGSIPRVWVASPIVADAMRACRAPIRLGNPDSPMFDSIRAGLTSALHSTTAGVFILPVDVPAPWLRTLESLAAATGVGVALPAFAGQRGHPAALSRRWIERVLLPAPAGARLDRLIGPDAIELPVEDASVVVNLNTPRDVERWLAGA
jgi:CTP:molybdopterin cytidylyltransferase MocA